MLLASDNVPCRGEKQIRAGNSSSLAQGKWGAEEGHHKGPQYFKHWRKEHCSLTPCLIFGRGGEGDIFSVSETRRDMNESIK